MLTIHEQERFAFCAGLPSYDAIAEACTQADEIEALEQEVEQLQEQVKELEQWRDGDMETKLEEQKATNRELRQKNAAALTVLRTVLAQLEGKECNNAAGRKLLAKHVQSALIRNR